MSPKNPFQRNAFRGQLLTFDEAYEVLEITRGPSTEGWYSAICPNHDDEHASLGVKEAEDGGLIVVCHASCPAKEVYQAIRELLK